MVRSFGKKLWREESGAVASIYALALPALIAIGGIAFDYTRLAAMDTELQNAADQAALAAVTQLDGRAGAVSRATNAIASLIDKADEHQSVSVPRASITTWRAGPSTAVATNAEVSR